jgi:hypothetical protein
VTQATDNMAPTMPPNGNERLVGIENLLGCAAHVHANMLLQRFGL